MLRRICRFLASHAEGFHLRVLLKPCMNLSIHTASDVRPPTLKTCQWGKSAGLTRRTRANHCFAPLERPRRRLNFRCAFRRSRPLIPTDHDHLFRSIATSVARMLIAPLDDGGDVSLLWVGQARREAVPVVNRRDPRATRSALTADAAARAGGPC